LRAGDRFGLAQDRDHGDARLGAKAGLGEGLSDPGAVVRNRDLFDLELAQRHLEVLDDLGALEGAADDGAELARLVVVESDHRQRLFVAGVREVVELTLAVVVQDHGEAAAGTEPKGEFRTDARQACLFDLDWQRQPPSASLETGKRSRPISFDSFISATPIVAVIST
jgi:hypothetical protein